MGGVKAQQTSRVGPSEGGGGVVCSPKIFLNS